MVLPSEYTRAFADGPPCGIHDLSASLSAGRAGQGFPGGLRMTVTGLEPAKTSKGEQTRAVILETALEMFRERGYEETTMRAIAERADVSLGNAYYYFRSKEHLIQAFYNRLQEQHLAASAEMLETEPE